MPIPTAISCRSSDEPFGTSRYFSQVIEAAPAYWYRYRTTPSNGVAEGIFAVGSGFESTLAVDADTEQVSLFVMVAEDTRARRLPSALLLQLQCRCRYTRILVDTECNVLRLEARTYCSGPKLRAVVQTLFSDVARLLGDDRFIDGIASTN